MAAHQEEVDAHQRRITSIMREHDLLGHPAFEGGRFIISPVACLNGCPLGLYTWNGLHDWEIQLPLVWGEPTLLHELGHRFGHFIYGDTSEEFAESFRGKMEGYNKSHVLAEGGLEELRYLARNGAGLIYPDEEAVLTVRLNSPPSDEEFEQLRQRLASVKIRSLSMEDSRLRIHFVNNNLNYGPFNSPLLPSLSVVASAVTAVFSATISSFVFTLIRGSPKATLLAALLAGASGFMLWKLAKKI